MFLFSCQTNKMPKWISEPPPEDDLHIYFVGYGKGIELEDIELMAFNSVISQIQNRFSYDADNSIDKLFLGLLKQSYYQNNKNSKASVIDSWSDEDELYILVRFKKEFILPLIDSYLNSLNGLEVEASESELLGDKFFLSGNMYRAFTLYIDAATEMLVKDDEAYFFPIIRCLDKGLEIINPIKYTSTETFSELIINEALYSRESGEVQKRLFFKVDGLEGMDYSGFQFTISFSEGWDKRERVTDVALVKNSLEFVPPIAKVSGISSIESEINISDIRARLKNWEEGYSVSFYIQEYLKSLDQIINRSKIAFNYTVKQDINIRPKLISFNNSLTTEGVVRFLLENDEYSEAVSFIDNDESLQNYVRELNRSSENMFSYLILGEVLTPVVQEYDEGMLYKLTGEFSLIDLRTSTVITKQKLQSEFLGSIDDDDLAYLDLGLKIGEVVSQLNF